MIFRVAEGMPALPVEPARIPIAASAGVPSPTGPIGRPPVLVCPGVSAHVEEVALSGSHPVLRAISQLSVKPSERRQSTPEPRGSIWMDDLPLSLGATRR